MLLREECGAENKALVDHLVFSNSSCSLIPIPVPSHPPVRFDRDIPRKTYEWGPVITQGEADENQEAV